MITKYRYRKGLTQSQIATKVKVDPSIMSGWEKGNTTPKRKHLNRLMVYLGTLEK
ncbi:MAG: helix-turn-helix transcriptional regulator [Chitinophagaceae bacterium]